MKGLSLSPGAQAQGREERLSKWLAYAPGAL